MGVLNSMGWKGEGEEREGTSKKAFISVGIEESTEVKSHILPLGSSQPRRAVDASTKFTSRRLLSHYSKEREEMRAHLTCEKQRLEMRFI